MAKSIIIPADRGSRITVWINGVEYVYAAGATVTVPDEVAAAIADMLAMDPSGTRESALGEALNQVNQEITEIAADVEDLKEHGTGGRVVIPFTYNSTSQALEFEDEDMTEGAFYEAITGSSAVVLNRGSMSYELMSINAGDDDYIAEFFSTSGAEDTVTGYYVTVTGDIGGTEKATIEAVSYELAQA